MSYIIKNEQKLDKTLVHLSLAGGVWVYTLSLHASIHVHVITFMYATQDSNKQCLQYI